MYLPPDLKAIKGHKGTQVHLHRDHKVPPEVVVRRDIKARRVLITVTVSAPVTVTVIVARGD